MASAYHFVNPADGLSTWPELDRSNRVRLRDRYRRNQSAVVACRRARRGRRRSRPAASWRWPASAGSCSPSWPHGGYRRIALGGVVPSRSQRRPALLMSVLGFLMWGAMVLAMMLPTAGPMILTYAEIAETAARKGEPIVSPLCWPQAMSRSGSALRWSPPQRRPPRAAGAQRTRGESRPSRARFFSWPASTSSPR